MATWYDSTLIHTEECAPNVRIFHLRMPEGQRLEFKAGQFITFDLPIGDKRLQRWRSYSIASAPEPGGNDVLELCIVRSESGAGTQYLFDEIKVGDTVRFKGPDGAFYLPENLESKIVLICTGTGIVPFRSMLQDVLKQNRAHNGIHLIFGARFENGILYRDEMEALTQQLPGFEYDVVLSRQPGWGGHESYVHAVYLEKYVDPDPKTHFYICGWQNMVDEAVANLMVQMQIDPKHIHYELYG